MNWIFYSSILFLVFYIYYDFYFFTVNCDSKSNTIENIKYQSDIFS